MNVVEQREQFAHAILEARLRESFLSIEYKEVRLLPKDAIKVSEVLHEDTPAKIVEAVENIAKRISVATGKKRYKIISTPLEIGSADVRLSVLEFNEID